jgi:AraC family transcriptional regulator
MTRPDAFETAAELADKMPGRWGVAAGPRLLGEEDGLSALFLSAVPGEVWSHASSAHILSHVIRGEQRHVQFHDNRQIYDGPLASNSLNIVPAGRTPRAVISSPLQVLHIYLPHQALVRQASEAGWRGAPGALEIIDPRFTPDPQLERLCAVLLTEIEGETKPDRLFTDALGRAVQARLLQRWSNMASRRGAQKVTGQLAPWQLRRAIGYLESNLANEITLRDIAVVVGLSASHLAHAFKASSGQAPHAYRRRLRATRARQILEWGDMSIGEIAIAVGYETPQAFARMFRAEVGVSPSEYRRERRL